MPNVVSVNYEFAVRDLKTVHWQWDDDYGFWWLIISDPQNDLEVRIQFGYAAVHESDEMLAVERGRMLADALMNQYRMVCRYKGTPSGVQATHGDGDFVIRHEYVGDPVDD